MDVDSDNEVFFSVWTWVVVVVLFVLISVAIVYGFSTHRPVKQGIDSDRPTSLADLRLRQKDMNRTYPPPKRAPEPSEGDETIPAPKPRPKVVVSLPEEPAPEQPRTVADQPEETTAEPAPQPQPQMQSQPQPESHQLSSSFTCEGRQWRSTGRFASSEQLDLVPSNCSLEGRSLYALAGSGDHPQALFMQSGNDPDRYAVYR